MAETSVLGDFVDIDLGYPFASRLFTTDVKGTRLLRGDNVSQGRLRWDGVKRWPVDQPIPAGLLMREGDVVLAMDRPWIEAGLKWATIRADDTPSLLVQRVARLRARGPLLQEYLRCVIASQAFTDHVLGIQTGSTVPHISGAQIASFPVKSLPRRPVQQAIAALLGALDDKIESIDRALAVIARLVEAEVAQERHHSELSRSLHTAPLGELVDKVGVVVRPESITDQDRYIGLEHLPRRSMFLDTWASAVSLASHKTRFVQGDLLFGKLRPYFKKAGIAPVDGVCSTDILVLRPRHPGVLGLALVELTSDALFEYATNGSAGTRMPRVSWDYLSKWVVSMPAEECLGELSAITTPLIQLGSQLCRESPALASLRDTLLPELLSGRLRIPEAEELVESVT